MRYICLLTVFVLYLTSCNDWLDVRPDTEQKEEDQFSTVDGFYGALTGCYMSMASQDIYGERLTMSNIESLANLWYIQEGTTRYEDEDLTKHDYTTDYAKSAIQTIYAGLFNVITQANLIIKHADEQKDVFTSEVTRSVIQGEAYAIRAFCQFDVLRLFGQMPVNATKLVSLPYSFTTSIYEMPAYYDFNEYVVLLKKDLEQAETLLKDNDPIFQYTFDELNGGGVSDEYMMYRQSRLNYWAVKALEARINLYLGEKGEAYRIAKEIIDAKGVDGSPVREMSGADEIAEYNLLPSECLFHLSKYDLMDYIPGLLIGRTADARFNGQLVLTNDMLSDLFAGENTASHNRRANCWRKDNEGVPDSYGQRYPVTTKYYINDDAENKTLYCQIIPMLRMSEMYLIAMETSTDLSEVNTLYQKYMIEHAVANMPDFTSLEAAKEWIINEYRREFFVEGQMFYTYKRTGATQMLWREQVVTESEYILPLPNTEYNPSNL